MIITTAKKSYWWYGDDDDDDDESDIYGDDVNNEGATGVESDEIWFLKSACNAVRLMLLHWTKSLWT